MQLNPPPIVFHMTVDDDLKPILDTLLVPRRRAAVASSAAWTSRHVLARTDGDLVWWSAGDGPIVMLVHGWEGTHADLDAFVEPLVARGFRVVAADSCAHGESGGAIASIPIFSRDIEALAHVLAPASIAAIVAHSMGGAAVADALARGLQAQRVVLVASPHQYERYVRWRASEHGIDAERLIEAVTTMGVDVASTDLRETVAGLTTPALIVHATDDRTVDMHSAKAITASWPGSQLRLFEGLGHNRILRDATVVDEIVAYVATLKTCETT